MKLWLLRPIKPKEDPWRDYWDKCHGFIIRAESPARARYLANEQAGDENRSGHTDVWLDQTLTTCVPITADGPEETVMTDFQPG